MGAHAVAVGLETALNAGDTAGIAGLLADDAALFVPGDTGLSGPYHGRDAIVGLLERLAAGGVEGFSFAAERVLADPDLAMILGRATCVRRHERHTAPTVLTVVVRHGRIIEIRMFHHHPLGLDRLCS